MDFSREKAKLLSLLDEDVWELLKANNAIIAGGAITSLFTNSDVADIDVYLPSERQVVNILAAAFCEEEYTESVDYIGSFEMIFINLAKKSMTFKNGEQEIQLVTFHYFDTPEQIFDTFDFTVCMGAYVVAEDRFELHPEFLKHNSQRYLKYNNKTSYPLVSALRSNKYKDKGYTIAKSEFLRILFSCMELKLESWEDAKEHIGGMYGYNMEEFFDEEKEFNLSELMDQMENRDYTKRQEMFQVAEMNFVEILNKFDPAEGFKEPKEHEKSLTPAEYKYRVLPSGDGN